MTLLAKEAAMRPLRRLLVGLEPAVYAGSPACSGLGASAAAVAATAVAAAAAPSGQAAPAADALCLGPVTAEDLEAALSVTKPSAKGYEKQYAEFTSKFGQAGDSS